VEADTPVTPGDAQARGLHTKRRRRPAIGAEADRRRAFGRIYGAANREAGQQVREERGE